MHCYVGGKLNLEDLSDLYEALMPARVKWFELGLALGLDNDTLEAVKVEHRDQPDICLRAMLTARLKSTEPLSLDEVCSCLQKTTVGRADLAREIESGMYSNIVWCMLV